MVSVLAIVVVKVTVTALTNCFVAVRLRIVS